MKFQLPTIIIICLSILLILAIHFLGGKNTQYSFETNVESEDFNLIRIDAINAYNAQDFTQAIQLFEQAFDLRPENAEVCNDLAAAHYDLGLKYAGPEWPSWPVIHSDGSSQDVLTELDRAFKHTESGYIVVEFNSAKIAETVEQAAKEKGAAVFTHHGNKDTVLNILIGGTKDHLLQASSLYLQAIELKSTYAAPYRNIGSFYVKIGLTDKAINYYEEAFKREPSDTDLAEYLHQFRSDY